MARHGRLQARPETSDTAAIAAASELLTEIYRIYGVLRTLIISSNAGVRLAPLEALALGTIVELPGPLTVAHVARLTGYSRQAVQRAAGALRSAGLIELATNPRHKRSPLLVATEEGRAAKADVERARNRLAELLAAESPGPALRDLLARLAALRDGIERHAPGVLGEVRRARDKAAGDDQ